MLKKILLLFSIIFFVSAAFAEMSFVTETEKTTLLDNQTLEFGDIQRGETLELRLSSDAGNENEWTQLIVLTETLPLGWKAVNSEKEKKVLIAAVTVPLQASLDAYQFKVKAVSPLKSETVNARVILKEGLVSADISATVMQVTVNKETEFELTIFNKSNASHKVIVSSNLPVLWFKPVELTLKPKEIRKVSLKVTPRVYGFKSFQFQVKSAMNNELFALIPSQLVVEPTIKDKYSAGLYGFPFFTMSLFPFYLINSFLSLLI